MDKSTANADQLAREYGALTERIIAAATECGIYAHQAPELFSLLAQLDLDEQLPEEKYRTIVELVLWMYAVDTA